MVTLLSIPLVEVKLVVHRDGKEPSKSSPPVISKNLLPSLASLNKQAKQMRAVTWSFRYNAACVGEGFLWELHKSCIRLEQAENIFERLKVKRVAILNEEQLYIYNCPGGNLQIYRKCQHGQKLRTLFKWPWEVRRQLSWHSVESMREDLSSYL